MKHKCPKNGCEVMCPRSRLACYPHWQDVPKPLQREVNRAWRNFADDPEPYLQARQRAVDAMNGVS